MNRRGDIDTQDSQSTGEMYGDAAEPPENHDEQVVELPVDIESDDGSEDREFDPAAEIERLQDEAARNLDSYQRAVAELANYRRRKDQESTRLIEQARHTLLRKILPVVDDFERALKDEAPDAAVATWLDGFRLIDRKLWSVLESEGVRTMECVGEEFDPNLHEAVLIDDSVDGDHKIVVEEFQRGYFIRDMVLRPAMVKVGSAESNEEDEG